MSLRALMTAAGLLGMHTGRAVRPDTEPRGVDMRPGTGARPPSSKSTRIAQKQAARQAAYEAREAKRQAKKLAQKTDPTT